MNELFAMTFGRVFFTLASAPMATVMAVCSAFALCLLFQVTLLRSANRATEKSLRAAHFVWVALFILYLMTVYRLTGIGTLHGIIETGIRIVPETIHLIPFMSFADGLYGLLFFALNILMTIPLGLFLASLWPTLRSYKYIALIGFFFSLSIELSQLFTMRGTNVDDLIANTFGAVLGYMLFKLISNYCAKRYSKKSERKRLQQQKRTQARELALSRSRILRNEGIAYVALSFLGMFLLYSPNVVTHIDEQIGLPGVVIHAVVYDYDSENSHATGTVLELDGDSLIIEVIKTEEFDGGTLAVSTDDTLRIYFTENTTVDIQRLDEHGAAFPVAVGTNPLDIKQGDIIDVYFEEASLNPSNSSPQNPAKHINAQRLP
ncbi:MAG: VanZ family protein [Coriobacteriia bacterium]|nr:VanZ family protein [Coriobacteriia bacterium]